MDRSGESRWIVIIDKSPRGPLTREEIRALLDEGAVRVNDVAYKVKTSEDDPASEWKFLWQFVEFDRRANEKSGTQTQNETAPAAVPEDRRKAPPQAIPNAIDHVPEDILDISPEDLIIQSQKQSASLQSDFSDSTGLPNLAPSSGGMGRSLKSAGVLLGGVGALALTIAFTFWSNDGKKVDRGPAQNPPREVPAAAAGETSPSPGILGVPTRPKNSPEAVRTLPPSPNFSSPPSPRDEPFRRDAGEIPPPDDRLADDPEDDLEMMDNAVEEPPPMMKRRKRPGRRPAEEMEPADEADMPEAGEVY